ncbi:MAG TPA: ATP-binding protein, partial [Hellea balneolensis]|nr:ATP-binding protein [Hellea balneolensis]
NAQDLLQSAAQTLGLTARGYHRILRVARTLADLDGCENIKRLHVAEALSHRRSDTSASGQRQQAKSRQSWPK